MPRSNEGLARLVRRLRLDDPRIAEAFRAVDRAGFVPEGLRSEAYRDRPVPIPEGQTTSQPSLIAHMIAAARPGPDDKILEVGTGFGYQTALLAQLARRVISIDLHQSLVERAAQNLERNQVGGVSVYKADGWEGWPDEAPYDAVIVAASADGFPKALGAQLAEGGRLVIPLKTAGSDDVYVFEKKDGKVEKVRLLSPARFVPLVKGAP
jgi:protein-L-isoaspartate(D-aspartate) O-methyltransferase